MPVVICNTGGESRAFDWFRDFSLPAGRQVVYFFLPDWQAGSHKERLEIELALRKRNKFKEELKNFLLRKK